MDFFQHKKMGCMKINKRGSQPLIPQCMLDNMSMNHFTKVICCHVVNFTALFAFIGTVVYFDFDVTPHKFVMWWKIKPNATKKSACIVYKGML